jgi:lactoylglutathione lyase
MKIFSRLTHSLLAASLCAGILTGAAIAQNAPPAPAAQAPQPVADLPIHGIAGVTFKTSDMAKARAYYNGVLGFDEAFDLKDASGQVTSAYFKVNDDQYIEVVPGLKPDDLVRQARIIIQSSDLQKLHAAYVDRGVNPGSIATGPDGNPTFRITAPNGFIVDFIQYVPTSKQGQLRGKNMPATRLSSHIWHVGTMAKDADARAFFSDKLGFGRMLPGTRGEYVETPASDSNLETKDPPLDPNNPATQAQYTREVYGAVYHVALEVTDMRTVRDTAQKRGNYSDVRVRAAMGRGQRRWLMHLFDPDGSRTEFLETQGRDLPPNTVMAPGPEAPPIMPTASGGFGWPAPKQ